MKIAVIALASAALIGFAQPGFAQQKMDQDQSNRMDRSPDGSGMQSQFQDEDETGTSGQGNNWSDRDGWRDQRSAGNDQDEDRMHHGSMRGHMQGGMTPPWRMHERMARANEAAHFRFRRGAAVIDVQCPEGESLQTCVSAAGQLLDKIATLRGSAQGTTSGSGLGSSDSNTSSQPGDSLPNRQLNPRRPDDSTSGQ